jgi:hypothetical protein
MGLNTNARTLFSPAWQEALRGAPESAMVATVLIFANSTNEVYDPDTDTWTNVVTPLYSGKARVQPMRNANNINQIGNATTVQAILVSVPVSAETLNLRPGHRLNVLTSPLNPALLTYQFVLSDITDSSNPIERTLMFTVDQETANP